VLTQLLPRSLAALHVAEGMFEKSAFSQLLFFRRSSRVEALLLASLWPALKRGSSQATRARAARTRSSGSPVRPISEARPHSVLCGWLVRSEWSPLCGRGGLLLQGSSAVPLLRMRMHAALILLHHHRCLSRLPLQLNHTMCSFCNPALYRLACVLHLSLQEEW
jgi:hypothetical protein